MLREEIDGNDEISVKHQNSTLNYEINSDSKGRLRQKSKDKSIFFVKKHPEHLQDRLRHNTTDEDVVFA